MSSISNRLLEELDRMDGKLVWWRPSVGDQLAGKVIKRFQMRAKFGSREALVVEKDDGNQVTVVLSKVLLDAFGDVDTGWWIAVEFLGKTGSYLQYKTAKMSPEQAAKER